MASKRDGRVIAAGIVAAIIGAAVSLDAAAAVTQPNGETMPVPTNSAEVAVVTSRGFLADTVRLEGLFKYRMENLNPIQDAQTTPGAFSPKCEFTGQLVLRGGSCRNAFGWYNVTPGSTTPPPANEIFQLVPAELPMCPMPINMAQACCDDGDFCPLADTTTTQTMQHHWNAPVFTAASIRKDARYKGGLIGFALMAGSDCNQTKFSQAELNVKSPAGAPTNGAPWVTVLVYQSTRDPNGYYLAFEDRRVATASWKGDGTGGANDGDFNDFVYFVRGLNCEGGGKECNTSLPGICSTGTTLCTNGTAVTCKPDVAVGEKPESCDGLDNNCDGMVDEGNPCMGVNQLCDRGVCVQKCNDSEFPCAPGSVCDNGYCKDPSCIGKDCPVGQICSAGTCVGGCDGVVCPQSQVCRLGRCIDPCMGVTCAEGICENGACVPACPCRTCGTGRSCKETDGHCVETGCEKMNCGAGMVCLKGNCVDPCSQVKCPGGQKCEMGSCVNLPNLGTGGFVGTLIDAGGSGGRPVFGTGGSSGTGSTGGGVDAGAGEPGTGGNGVKRCGCDVGGPSAGVLSVLSMLLAAAVASRRRHRS